MIERDNTPTFAAVALIVMYSASVAGAFAIHIEEPAILHWASNRGYDGAAGFGLLIMVVSAIGSAVSVGSAITYWQLRAADRVLKRGAKRSQLPEAAAVVFGFLFAVVPYAIATW